MHKTATILAAAAVLATTAACSSTTTTSTPADTATSAAPAPKTTPSTRKTCTPTRDVIVRYVTPGNPATAQTLGNYNLATCQPTFTWLKQTAPAGAGYCTQAAWASDNPGYNTDAEPARPLKQVQVTIGPAC